MGILTSPQKYVLPRLSLNHKRPCKTCKNPTSANVRVKPVLTVTARTVLDTSQHSPQLYDKKALPRLGFFLHEGVSNYKSLHKDGPSTGYGFLSIFHYLSPWSGLFQSELQALNLAVSSSSQVCLDSVDFNSRVIDPMTSIILVS